MRKRIFLFILILVLITSSCNDSNNRIKEGPEYPKTQPTEDIPTTQSQQEKILSLSTEGEFGKKLLIFLSPQYSQDLDIIKAIKTYQESVERDVKWGSEVILLNKETNTIGKIREKIKTEHKINHIKAVIIVGEDTETILNVETLDKKEVPSVFLWSDLDEDLGYSSYTILPSMSADEIDNILKNSGSTVTKPSMPEVTVSLLYPSISEYEEKKEKIISAFDKFSNRQIGDSSRIKIIQFDYTKDTEGNKIKEVVDVPVHPFLKPLLNSNAETLFDCDMCNLALGKNCTICNFGLEKEYKAYIINSHGSPDKMQVSSKGFFFTTKDLERLKSPIFAALGCHSTGWYTSTPPNKKLDPPEGDSFSQYIFTNPDLRVFIGGGTTYNGDDYSDFFKKLDSGMTIAEAFIGSQKTLDGAIIYGDPTFHYP